MVTAARACCFCMVNIDGGEYILDSLHEKLWDVDLRTGSVQLHRTSRAQYAERGTAITPVEATVMDHRLTQLEELLDRESSFCLRWLREFGHEDAEVGKAQAMAAELGTSIAALRDRHALIEVDGEQCKLSGIGAYHLKRPYLGRELTEWERCFRAAFNSVPPSDPSLSTVPGSLELRRRIKDAGAGGMPTSGVVEALALMLAIAMTSGEARCITGFLSVCCSAAWSGWDCTNQHSGWYGDQCD